MRRRDDTIRQTLLDDARTLAETEGIDAINIRSIARRAGVATGTVYNYFSNKDEILLALTEAYWRKTLLEMETAITADSFCGQLEELFTFLQERIDRSAGVLMRSLGNVEAVGHRRMSTVQEVYERTMLRLLEQDEKVRRDIWDEAFTKEQFVRFIMMNMMSLLRTRSGDIHFFLTIVKRIIY